VQLNGAAVSYVVSVATKGVTGSAVPGTLSLPPASVLRMISMMALLVLLVVVTRTSKIQDCYALTSRRFAGAVAATVLLAVVIAIAGCGGGSIAAPQSIPTPTPTPQPVVTPQGTFTLTLTPSATTAGGTALPPITPIPLTLIVK
jgi:hypothetical protein